MGRYIGAAQWINVNRVYEAAEVMGLPAPKEDKNSHCAVMSARDAKKWVDYSLLKDRQLARDGYTAFDIHSMTSYELGGIISTQMSCYITSACDEADQLGLSGGPRKNFLRKKTKAFQVVWA